MRFLKFNVMKNLLTLLLIVFLSIVYHCQENKSYLGNFQLEKYLLENKNSPTPLGFFVKGNTNKIKGLCSQHNGLYLGSVKGWHYVKIPTNQYKAFNDNVSIQQSYISLHPGTALNDTMRVNNRINDVHAGVPPLNTAYTGKDVVIGFIDTGIDWMHGDFKNADGSTRILSLWDQTKPISSNTPSYGYGQHWDSSEINLGIPTNNRPNSYHGSTVAGCAAGNGLASGYHKGVAPESDIIVVQSNFNAADWLSTVVDATDYIYKIADSLGKPCVINGSLGTYFGSHDGLDPYSLYIDSLIQMKRGHLFVCSAGNSGNWGAYHLHADVNNDTTFTWFKPHSSWGYVFAELWADTGSFNQVLFSMGADMHSPNYSHRGQGQYFDIQSNITAPSSLLYDTIRNSNGDQIATIMYYAEQVGGLYMLQAYIPYADSTSYHYRFQTTGAGSYDIWSEQANLGVSDMVPEDQLPTSIQFPEIVNYTSPDTLSTLVSSFQCLQSTITVANYINAYGFVNNQGSYITKQCCKGELSLNSSKGPTRSGLLKPDVAASGDNTYSAWPVDLLPSIHDSILAIGGMHMSNGGTSMSSPVVAGIAALYLEKCNTPSFMDFKNDLTNAAYADQFTGTLPNFAFGYGKADGYNTLLNTIYTPTILNNGYCINEDSTEINTFLDYEFYFWSSGSSFSSSFYSASNNQFLLVTDSAGCKSDTAFFDVIEHPLPPVPTITIDFDELIADPGYNDYQWYINGTLLNGENDSTLIADINGNYQVEVFDQNGCSSISDSTLFNFVSIEENSLTTTIYPVPSKNSLTINANSEILNYLNLNNNGQIVNSYENAKPEREITINITNLKPGIYILMLSTKDGLSLNKFNKL